MEIKNKEQFNELVAKMYKRGARFNFDCCEIALLNNIMLVNEKKAPGTSRYLVDTKTGNRFWVYNGEVCSDCVLLENESQEWTMLEISHACHKLPKHKADKIMRILEDEDVSDSESVELNVDYSGEDYMKHYFDWQKQIMCGEMPCDGTMRSDYFKEPTT